MATYGWKGTVAEFLADQPAIPEHLVSEHRTHYMTYPGQTQRTAWDHEVRILADAFGQLPTSRDWGLVMEYELPFEGGRRIDKVTLAAQDVVVALEFKDTDFLKEADVDQVRAYARDLNDYHSACRNKHVEPVLVLANADRVRLDANDATVVSPDNLPFALAELAHGEGRANVDEWLAGTYAPLPTLVEAARRVFNDEPLPAIKRAVDADIPKLLSWLHDLVRQAERNSERHLVLITGVPGSGKTLVGLQFVHEFGEPGTAPAVFLSGNGPLVQVLQYVLQSKVFVRPMRNFILEYGIRQHRLPSQRVIVFDEAQRAWDSAYVKEKHGADRSEPDMLVDLATRLPGWAVLIGLVGEGQEIYLGEERGLGQWATAIAQSRQPFAVHAPEHVADLFPIGAVEVQPLLDLTTSLRTHRARYVQEWVDHLIHGRIADAARLAPSLVADRYDLYVTTDLFEAQAYLRSRYADAPEKRYGLLASSKARNLPSAGIDNGFYAMQRLRVGPWFSAPPTDTESCCQFRLPATEFQCQGLELDMPIVCWGDDLRWMNEEWAAWRKTRHALDSDRLRLNSYRVLLTRGRDGSIIYVPSNLPNDQQRAIVEVLRRAGVRMLGPQVESGAREHASVEPQVSVPAWREKPVPKELTVRRQSPGRRLAKPILDTKTGREYPSEYQAGKDVATREGGDPTNTHEFFRLARDEPKRFKTRSLDGDWVYLDDPRAPRGTTRR